VTGHSPDCRERALLNYVLQNAEKGNAESVLRAIDSFTHHTWLAILGKEKGSLLDAAVQKFDSRVALELGTYCGYSAIRIASKMGNPDSKLISIEVNSHNYAIAREMIEHAGLSSKVTVLKGTLTEVLDELDEFLNEMAGSSFDFIFMDHFKHCYLPDFLLLKERSMLGKGTCIVADSIGFPKAQNYLNYLKEHHEELETEAYKSDVECLSWFPSTMTVSTYKVDVVRMVT
jgi:catechol O-methyltransferase